MMKKESGMEPKQMLCRLSVCDSQACVRLTVAASLNLVGTGAGVNHPELLHSSNDTWCGPG